MKSQIELANELVRHQLTLRGRVPRNGFGESELRRLEGKLGFAIPESFAEFLRYQNGVGGAEGIVGGDDIIALHRELVECCPAAKRWCPVQRSSLDEFVAIDPSGRLFLVSATAPPRSIAKPLWRFLVGWAAHTPADPSQQLIGSPTSRAELAWNVVKTWYQLVPDSTLEFGPRGEALPPEWASRVPAVVRELYRMHSSLSLTRNGEKYFLLFEPRDFDLGRRWNNGRALSRSRQRLIGPRTEPAAWWSDDWITVSADDADLVCVDCKSPHGRVLQIFHDDEYVPILGEDLAEYLAFGDWMLRVELTS